MERSLIRHVERVAVGAKAELQPLRQKAARSISVYEGRFANSQRRNVGPRRVEAGGRMFHRFKNLNALIEGRPH